VDVLHKTEVVPSQIDHLGHMNVRFYGEHARTGADRVLDSLGLEPDDRRTVIQRDTYTRHHNEQLVGASLEVRGGVLDASSKRIRLYEELVNSDRGDIAATFVLTFELGERATREPGIIDDAIVERARASIVAIPEHGMPRSISVDEDLVETGPTLEALQQHDLAMRQVRTVQTSDCDADGFVQPLAVPELVWGGQPIDGREFRPLETLADGGQMGFATMETRASWVRFARAGDHVQSFAAQIAVYDKAMLSRHWLADVDRGDLVAVFSVVSLAFDITNRRAISLPNEVRQRFESRLHPELASPPRG